MQQQQHIQHMNAKWKIELTLERVQVMPPPIFLL